MTRRLSFAIGLAACCSAGAALAQVERPFGGPALAQDRVLSRAIGSLQVTSGGLLPGDVIPLASSGYGKSTSFPVSWSPVPEARAYAVIMEELDKGEERATLYWLAYNIPAAVTALGRSVHDKQVIEGPKGLMQGRNSWGGIGYVGPHPPVGDGPHRFHVQVFALNRKLPLGGGADLNQVVQAMSDHVLAEGELIASFEAPRPGDTAPAAKAPKPPH